MESIRRYIYLNSRECMQKENESYRQPNEDMAVEDANSMNVFLCLRLEDFFSYLSLKMKTKTTNK